MMFVTVRGVCAVVLELSRRNDDKSARERGGLNWEILISRKEVGCVCKFASALEIEDDLQ